MFQRHEKILVQFVHPTLDAESDDSQGSWV